MYAVCCVLVVLWTVLYILWWNGSSDAGMGVHYGGIAPLPIEREDNGGIGALT